jgi:hypothetical protein
VAEKLEPIHDSVLHSSRVTPSKVPILVPVLFSTQTAPLLHTISSSHADGSNNNSSNADRNKKKNYVGGFHHSSCNLKRVARMPVKDRKEILKILVKQAKQRKARFLAKKTNSKGAGRTNSSKELSNTSLSSVTKDMELLVNLQGGTKVAIADVYGIDSMIGVKYKGDVKNNFNVLSKEGRRDLRAAVRRILSKGES